MKKYIVYLLLVEDENTPFYVGKTYIGSGRYKAHIYESMCGKKSAKAHLIRKAILSGKKIVEKIVLETDCEIEAFSKEIELIQFYGRKDNKTGILCNHTDGGEGASGTTRDTVKKEIHCYSISGKYIRTFDSTVEASKVLQINRGSISSNLTGLHKNVLGKNNSRYIFSYTKEKNLRPVYLGKTQQRLILGKVIDETKIIEFNSMQEASRVTGVSQAAISIFLANKRKQNYIKSKNNIKWIFYFKERK